MLRKFIRPFLFLPLCLYIYSHKSSTSQAKDNFDAMVLKDKEFVLDFFKKLSEDLQKRSKFTVKNLEDQWNEKLARSHFSLARRLAFAREMKSSKENFLISFKNSSTWKVKLASLIAILSILIGFNVEWMRIFSPQTLRLDD